MALERDSPEPDGIFLSERPGDGDGAPPTPSPHTLHNHQARNVACTSHMMAIIPLVRLHQSAAVWVPHRHRTRGVYPRQPSPCPNSAATPNMPRGDRYATHQYRHITVPCTPSGLCRSLADGSMGPRRSRPSPDEAPILPPAALLHLVGSAPSRGLGAHSVAPRARAGPCAGGYTTAARLTVWV